MTKPARGVFRAISTFARYVTPSAPGSLSVNQSRASDVGPNGSASKPSGTPDTDDALFDEDFTSTPRFLTPTSSTTNVWRGAEGVPNPRVTECQVNCSDFRPYPSPETLNW